MSAYILTTPQWHALRLIIHRLRCEAAQEPFVLEDIGQSWLPSTDVVVATADDGKVPIAESDLMFAVIMTCWTLITTVAETRGVDAGSVISEFALEVAAVEP